MIDLVNRAKGINITLPAPKEKKTEKVSVLYTKTTLKILKCVMLNRGIIGSEVAKSEKISAQYVYKSLAAFNKAGILKRSYVKTATRPAYAYSIALSLGDIRKILKHQTHLSGFKVMGPIEKRVLGVIKKLGVCRAHHISEATGSYNEYISVYTRRLIKRGLVVSSRIEGAPGTQCTYSINHNVVAA